MLLSDTELATQRAVAAAMLPDDCIIQTSTTTPDKYGSESKTWTNAQTVRCAAIGPQPGTLSTIDEQVRASAIWHVHFPYGTAVQEGNRLLINGHTLTVQVVLDPNAYSVLTSVYAQEVK